MTALRFLLRLVPSDSGHESALRVIRGVASGVGVRAVNAKWTSYGALELDVFAKSRPDFETFIAALEPLARVEFVTDLSRARPPLSKRVTVAEAISLFNSERFWEAHEVLESLWRVAHGEEKDLLQGLILVCAALVHHQKGEQEVALGIIQRALPKLRPATDSYFGMEIALVRSRAAKMLDEKSVSAFKI